MCTANDMSVLPQALVDRMEVIELSGYHFHEKVAISLNHLIPKILKEHGLSFLPNPSYNPQENSHGEKTSAVQHVDSTPSSSSLPSLSVMFETEAVEYIINKYCREVHFNLCEFLVNFF